MKLSYYDVTLRRMEEADKELIRYWRNSEKIKSRMEYRTHITRQMHNEWFEKMNDYKKAFSFIIEYRDTSVGVVYNSNFNDYSEGGMFIWDELCLGTQVPVLVSVMLTDLNFYFIGNEASYIKILKDNLNSQSFNKWFGYKLVDKNDENYNQRYVLTEAAYAKQSIKIKKMLQSYYKHNDELLIILFVEDIQNGLYDYYLPKLKKLNFEGNSIKYRFQS